MFKRQKKPSAPPWATSAEPPGKRDQPRKKPSRKKPSRKKNKRTKAKQKTSSGVPSTKTSTSSSGSSTSSSGSFVPAFGASSSSPAPAPADSTPDTKSRLPVPLWVILLIGAVLLIIVFMVIMGGGSDSTPTKDNPKARTKWYVQQAIDFYRAVPENPETDGKRQATISHYNSPETTDGSWYIFIIDPETGVLEASAPLQHHLGTTITDKVDVDGYAYGQELVDVPVEGKWVDYIDLDPTTREGALKHSWVVLYDGLIFGSGWYEQSYNRAPPTKAEPAAYTKALVEDAVWLYESEGLEALIEYSNSSENIEGEWYVFVFDKEGEILAHPIMPDDVGKSLLSDIGVDDDNYNFGSDMLEADEAGLWVHYESKLYSKDSKHAWIMKRDDIFIGSEWTESWKRLFFSDT